jgi:hypothetical protein
MEAVYGVPDGCPSTIARALCLLFLDLASP